MKIIFAGTPEIAVPALQALINSEHEVVAVYTKHDQPAGRGQKILASPVKQLAQAHHIPVQQPVTLRDPQEQALLKNWQADLMVVVAYGLILPKVVLETPRLGCINIHVSLLPRWRGAAPIQHAILAGDTETGVTIMQMDEGLDTGPILYQLHCPIYPTDTSQLLHDRLATLGAQALLTTLPHIANGTCTPQIQNEAQTCYAKKIEKQEAEINWHNNAEIIDRQIRAYNPWPIAHTHLNEQFIRIWQAEIIHTTSAQPPGTIINADKNGIDVATGNYLLRLQKIQLAGGRCLTVGEVLNARAEMFAVGNRFSR